METDLHVEQALAPTWENIPEPSGPTVGDVRIHLEVGKHRGWYFAMQTYTHMYSYSMNDYIDGWRSTKWYYEFEHPFFNWRSTKEKATISAQKFVVKRGLQIKKAKQKEITRKEREAARSAQATDIPVSDLR